MNFHQFEVEARYWLDFSSSKKLQVIDLDLGSLFTN